MKIAVSSSGGDLQSQIDPRFGRCGFFLVIETGDMSFEAFPNENGALGQGAGIQSAQFVASKGAEVVLTGHCGPNAVQTLSAAGIRIYTGQSGSVGEAVDRFNRGELIPTEEATVAGHFGMNSSESVQPGPAQGPGGGMGRGRGGCGRGGGGRGGGRGRGRCMGG
jgi:predicted Fe-Mo cluster-binding NifX family protein